MEPWFLVCESDASFGRLVTLLGRDVLLPLRFDDGKVVVRLAATKLTPLLLGPESYGITRLPGRSSSTPLNDAQLAALPAKLRSQLPQKAFMRDFFDAIRREFPHEDSFHRSETK